MHYHFQDVNHAFMGLVSFVDANSEGSQSLIKGNSRNGTVVRFEEPVTVTYANPKQRVLFNSSRDCNPFFHVYESMWMLAGRNDVAPLLNFVSKFDKYSDDGETLNGAYGYRWRQANGEYCDATIDESGEYEIYDQIEIIIKHLKDNTNSRRSVLQMWNVEDDLLKIDKSKDVCCNLSAVFEVVTKTHMEDSGGDRGDGQFIEVPVETSFLNMTVFNRSNDMILGMLGANVVHFSFLQEYIAQQIGIEVGKYHQISSNLHVYAEALWEPEKWLDEKFEEYQEGHTPLDDKLGDIEDFVQFFSSVETVKCSAHLFNFAKGFIGKVATPMMLAFYSHKARNYNTALGWCEFIKDPNWRKVCKEWIEKRQRNYLKKKEEENATI